MFLRDSGGTISVLNVPTFTALADHFLKCSKHFANFFSLTLMVANKSQVPILTHVTLTCHTTIDNNSRTFIMPFAVANIKYNILGTPFFEQHIKSLDIENMQLHFKSTPTIPSPTAPFVILKDKDYPYFSFIYTTKASKPLNFAPKSDKVIHFPIPNIKSLPFTTFYNEKIFPTFSHLF